MLIKLEIPERYDSELPIDYETGASSDDFFS